MDAEPMTDPRPLPRPSASSSPVAASRPKAFATDPDLNRRLAPVLITAVLWTGITQVHAQVPVHAQTQDVMQERPTDSAAAPAGAQGLRRLPSAPPKLIVKSAPASAVVTAPPLQHPSLRARELWLDSSRIAVFGRDGSGRPDLRSADAPDGVDAGLDRSPVFIDRSGRPSALPGGVIVTLPAGLDDARGRQMLRDQGLTPSRRLGPRLWLVEGPAGTGSLELAERILREGRFEAAEPNWWTPPVLK